MCDDEKISTISHCLFLFHLLTKGFIMKRTTIAYVIAATLTSSVVLAELVSPPNRQVDDVIRVPVDTIDHDGMESKRDDIIVVIRQIGDHDDSVGTRDKTGGIDTDFVAAPDPNDGPSNELPPVNCSHPSYASLCDDVKDSIGTGETGPEQNVWKVIFTGNNSNSASYTLEGTPKRIRINGSGTGESWFGENINRTLRKSAGGSDNYCTGKVRTAQCTWSFGPTGAKGCYHSVTGINAYYYGGANGGSCQSSKETATVNMKFRKIEVMY